MPAAARLGDPVGHEFDFAAAGGLFGSVLGAALAVVAAAPIAVLGTSLVNTLLGPFGAVLSCIGSAVLLAEAAQAGAWFGDKLGRQAGEDLRVWLKEKLGLTFMVTTGAIAIGDFTVLIEGMPAARSCVDFALCSRHPSAIPPSIVRGSRTITIGSYPAARVGDDGACTFVIRSGAEHVEFGGTPESCECARLWKQYRDEAEKLIAPHDHDHRLRNRAISKAYAELYLRNDRFIWAGLAAYASKQVGCAMDYAKTVARQGPAGGAYDKLAAFGADYTYDMLGDGNRELFLDVYPLHRFFEDHGFAKMAACAGSRTPPLPPEALAGFGALAEDPPDRTKSLVELANHEQLNILQVEIYNDYLMRRLLLINETGLPKTSSAAVSLHSDCNGEPRLEFNKGWNSPAHGLAPELYDPGERMNWILEEIGKKYEPLEQSPEHREHLKKIILQAPP